MQSSQPLSVRCVRIAGSKGLATALPSNAASHYSTAATQFAFPYGVALGDGNPFSGQHVNKADKRQPDQAGSVISFGALEQADTQSFCLEAACAVVGLFCEQVAFYLFWGEAAHMNGKGDAVGLIMACLAI